MRQSEFLKKDELKLWVGGVISTGKMKRYR